MSRKRRDAIYPKPIVKDMTLSQWFVGCALSNPNIVKDIHDDEATKDVIAYVEIATEALKAPNVPQRIEAPSEEEMERWVKIINNMTCETFVPRRAKIEQSLDTDHETCRFTKPIKKHT